MKWKLMNNAISYFDKIKLAFFVLTSNHYTNGGKVRKLEAAWNIWLGCKYSLFVSSGSTANFLLVAAIKELYNLKPGDKVLVPACTWVTNISPIIQLGLTPIFCDIHLSDFSFDAEQLKHIAKKHPNIKLIFITHLLGYTSNSRNSSILNDYFPKALVIDDVCEAHGCLSNNGAKIGSNSLGATFSTFFGHHLTTIEGGFVSTNNKELYDLMKMKRSHGMSRESINNAEYIKQYPHIDKSFLFITDGYNFRNNELSAVLGLSQLKRLDKSIKIRNENFKLFSEIIKKYNHLFHECVYSEYNSSFCLPFICKNSSTVDALKQLFIDNNIEYRPIVSGNLLLHPFLKEYSLCHHGKHKNIDLLHNNGLYIGNSQFITKKHLQLLDTLIGKLQ